MSGRLNGAGHLDGDLAAAEPNRTATGMEELPKEQCAGGPFVGQVDAGRGLASGHMPMMTMIYTSGYLARAGEREHPLRVWPGTGGGKTLCFPTSPASSLQVYGGDDGAGMCTERWPGVSLMHGYAGGWRDHALAPQPHRGPASYRVLSSGSARFAEAPCTPRFEDVDAVPECRGGEHYTACWPDRGEAVFRLLGEIPDRVEARERAWAPTPASRADVYEALHSRLAPAMQHGSAVGGQAGFTVFDSIDKLLGSLGSGKFRGFNVEPRCAAFPEGRENFASTRPLRVVDVDVSEQAPEHLRYVVYGGGTGSLVACCVAAALQTDASWACQSDGNPITAAHELLERRTASPLSGGAPRAADRVVLLDACSGSPAPFGSREGFLLLGNLELETPDWGVRVIRNGFTSRSSRVIRHRVVVARPEELGELAKLALPLTDSTLAALDLWAQAVRPDVTAVLLPVRLEEIGPASSTGQLRCFSGRHHDTLRLEHDALARVLREVQRAREAAAFAQALERRFVWPSADAGRGGPAGVARVRDLSEACRDSLRMLLYERMGARAAVALGPAAGVEAHDEVHGAYERSLAEMDRRGPQDRLKARLTSAAPVTPESLRALDPEASVGLGGAAGAPVPNLAADLLDGPVVVKFTRSTTELTGSWALSLRTGLRRLLPERWLPKSSVLAEKAPVRGRRLVIFIGQDVAAGGLGALALHKPRWLDRIRQVVAWNDGAGDSWYAEPGGVRDYFDWVLRPLSFGAGARVTCRDDVAADIAGRLQWMKLAEHDTEPAPSRFLAGLARRIATFHVEKAQGRAAWTSSAIRDLITHDALVCSQLHEIPCVERDRLDKDLRRLGGLLPCFYLVLDGFDAGGCRGARTEVARGGNRDERALQWSHWLASIANIKVETERSLDLDACLIRTPRSTTIYLSDHLPPREQEFAIFHELAHLRLGHVPNTSYGLEPSRLDAAGAAKFERQEAEADALAVVYRRVVRALVALVERDETPERHRRAAPANVRDRELSGVPDVHRPAVATTSRL